MLKEQSSKGDDIVHYYFIRHSDINFQNLNKKTVCTNISSGIQASILSAVLILKVEKGDAVLYLFIWHSDFEDLQEERCAVLFGILASYYVSNSILKIHKGGGVLYDFIQQSGIRFCQQSWFWKLKREKLCSSNSSSILASDSDLLLL